MTLGVAVWVGNNSNPFNNTLCGRWTTVGAFNLGGGSMKCDIVGRYVGISVIS